MLDGGVSVTEVPVTEVPVEEQHGVAVGGSLHGRGQIVGRRLLATRDGDPEAPAGLRHGETANAVFEIS